MNAAQAIQFGYDPYAAHPDTAGLFSSIKHAVSSAGKLVTKVASAPVNVTAAAAKAAGIPVAGKIVNFVAAPANYATKLGGTVASSTLNSIAHPNIKNIIANAQLAMKNAGPIGMVASGAVGAMQAGLSGKNLEGIAWAAAEGAAPSGIDTAIKAAEGLRHGKSVLTTALAAAAGGFTPASPEAFGFDTAIKALKDTASKEALGVARRALPSEGARRAFDVAVGVVSNAAKGAPAMSGLIPRAGSIPSIVLSRLRSPLSAVPSATQDVLNAIQRNPTLMSGDRQLLAQQMRTNSATVNDAMRLAGRNPMLLPWKSLQPHVVDFIRKYVPHAPLTSLRHAHTDTGGLDVTGTKYIVEKGDGPWAIAQKLSGNGNNWTQMKALNTDKNPTIDKNVWVGEVLNIPASWQKPVQMIPQPPPALPAVPPPTIAPIPSVTPAAAPAVSTIVPSILQAKAILAAWGKTDGINQGALPDYGINPVDLSTTMGPRDATQLMAFQVWDNRAVNAGLPVTGTLDAASLQALQTWATSRATMAIPVSPTPVIAAPPVYSLPNLTPTPVYQPPPAAAPTPAVATPSNPATGGPGGAMATGAIGAVLGGLLFGIPGALIGGVAGAAVGSGST